MTENKRNLWGIVSLVLLSCIAMAIIETVIEPAYAVKSACKGVFFLLLPIAVMKIRKQKIFDASFVPDKKGVLRLLGLGAFIYAIIMVAYVLTRNFFDYASLIQSLTADQQVTAGNFVGIALYISFGNSLLEEFLFRFVAFLLLKKYTARWVAYLFSSVLFAVYHIAMIGASFPLPLLLLSLLGLAIGGCIFNYVDEKNNNLYNSWMIHMFADFAIMTIWYIHI